MKTIGIRNLYRDYKSKKEVETAFYGNKDFEVTDFLNPYCGKPCNLSDLLNAGYQQAQIRYGNDRKVVILPIVKK